MQNPFLGRNLPLSELLARQQRYSGEGNNGWYQQAQLRNTNEAIDQFGRRRPQPMPRPQPGQMQRPQPRQMPQPMPAAPMPQPQVTPLPGLTSAPQPQVTPLPGLTSGRPQPTFGGFWNTLGLGGQIPGMGGPRGYGYGGAPALGGGPPLFRGFGTGAGQMPYQGLNRLY